MSSSFVVYIDESGDEGSSFGKGSSEWFVLSAVVTLKSEDLETVKLVDRVRTRLRRPEHKPLHFRDLRHEQRVALIAEIAAAPLRVITLLIHKPSITNLAVFLPGSRLYFQGVGALLERVSQLCINARPRSGDGTAEIVLSNRSELNSLRYEDLESSLLLRDSDGLTRRIIRRDGIYTCTAGRRLGLQIADAVASGFFKAVEPSVYGHTEERYARMLKTIVFRKEATYLGFGLQLWPMDTSVPPGDKRFDWIRQTFGEEEE